jgi:hypothetical protein
MHTEYYKLAIALRNATTIELLGREDVLLTAIQEWKEWYAEPMADERAILVVNGMSDSADRAMSQAHVPMSEVFTMHLLKQW